MVALIDQQPHWIHIEREMSSYRRGEVKWILVPERVEEFGANSYKVGVAWSPSNE